MLQEQSAVNCSGSRGKRLRTLSEEDQNVDYGTSPVTVPEIHDKDDEEEDEESRKKVYSTLILCFSFCSYTTSVWHTVRIWVLIFFLFPTLLPLNSISQYDT